MMKTLMLTAAILFSACADEGGPTGSSSHADYGTPCQNSDQCMSGWCIKNSDHSGNGICTYACGGDSECPHGTICELLDDAPAKVCVVMQGCTAPDFGVDGECQMASEEGSVQGPYGLTCKDKQSVPSDCTWLGVSDYCCKTKHY
ncbi:MAG TPA: hypothetical protein VL463_16785 [Kofleriaceae bacterium]|nr:hypothetical protein [Kofleriaceae bacterium]